MKRHGSPLNYDGSRGENFGKIKIKDNAKLTNKQKLTFNFNIGRRISEEDVIDNASNIFQQNKGYWPSEFCNDTDIAVNAERNNKYNVAVQGLKPGNSDIPKYKIICYVDFHDTDKGIREMVNLN